MQSLLYSFCSLRMLYQFPQKVNFEFPCLQLINACDTYPEYFSSSSVRLYNTSLKPEVVMSNYTFQGRDLSGWQNRNKEQIIIIGRADVFNCFKVAQQCLFLKLFFHLYIPLSNRGCWGLNSLFQVSALDLFVLV